MSYLFKYCARGYDKFMKKFKLDVSDEIIKNLGSVEGKKILDIGGGTGTLANQLQLKGAEVTLVDPSVEMTQEAKEKNKEIFVYAKTLQEAGSELKQEYFDKVIMRDALHHIREADEVMALSYKYLKPGGEIIIWEFNINSFKAKFIWFCETLCFEKSHMFTPETLSRLCSPYFKTLELNRDYDYEMLYRGEKRL